MQIPSHVEAMREAQALSMVGRGNGHQKIEAPIAPASGQDPAVVLDLSPEARAMMGAADGGLNPAQAARNYLTANPENDFKNFGQLVSSIARGVFDPTAVTETPDQSAALGEETLEELPMEETIGDDTPVEEVPLPVIADVVPAEGETAEQESLLEEAENMETTSSSVASKLMDDLLETLNGSSEDGGTAS